MKQGEDNALYRMFHVKLHLKTIMNGLLINVNLLTNKILSKEKSINIYQKILSGCVKTREISV